jgi:hypothetical protein
MEFFEHMDIMLKTLWFIALPTSLIFIILTIMTFIGMDASDGLEADFDGDFDGDSAPIQVFTLRNMINLLLGFSWTGIALYNKIDNTFILILISLGVGISFVIMFFITIRQIQKLGEDNSFKMAMTIDKNAEVYLSIPEKMTGKGKVLISIKGSMRELDAMTENDKIETGKVVQVTKIENDSILIVKSL